MTFYAFYTRREFDAQAEAEALGITCYVPRRVDLIRQGKRRRPDPVIRPYLPGYLFAETDAAGWHMLRGTKHLRTWMGIGPNEAANVMRFIEATEAEFHRHMAEIERAQKVLMDMEATKAQRREALKVVQQFGESELLEILDGAFKGRLARFAGIAERGASQEIMAELEVFGRTATLRLDPLAVRRAG